MSVTEQTSPVAAPVMGRPSAFRPEFIEQAHALAKLGLTDAEMADVFGVDVRTLHRWKIANEDFCHALTTGKEHADNRVERTLYAKAVGYDYTEEQAFKVKVGQYEEKIEVVEVRRHMPAETSASIFWLKNRRKEVWRDRHEIGGPDGGAIPLEVRKIVDIEALGYEERLQLRDLLEARIAEDAVDVTPEEE